MEYTLTKSNFEEIVLNSKEPVLVDFWAAWCGPCMMLAPTVEQVAKQANGSYKVGKVNVDEQPALAAKYGIESIPTLIVFKNGSLVKKSVGLCSKEQILSMLG